MKKAESIEDLLKTCPKNQTIGDNLIRAWSKVNDKKYKKIICCVSGGSDSDIMLDIIWKCDIGSKVDYVWFDTGLEYKATKDHLKYLNEKYNISIIEYSAIMPIPTTCKQHGQPFISKYVSEMIKRLQRHDFKWENKSFEELYKEYPKCKVALKWWCNEKESIKFNVEYNKYLKEFLTKNPPDFKISNMCCQYAKKDVAHKILKENNYDLQITGVRRSEGGIRAAAYKSCFDENETGCDNYRPLFWYTDLDKKDYENGFGITHSKCYTEYGLKRTGCACCPYGKRFEEELRKAAEYEPNLFKAANYIFNDTYAYTRKYREFVKKMKEKEECDKWK